MIREKREGRPSFVVKSGLVECLIEEVEVVVMHLINKSSQFASFMVVCAEYFLPVRKKDIKKRSNCLAQPT